MNFYDMLQLDPAVIKPKIKTAETSGEKIKLRFAIFLRSLFIVVFAIAFIAPMGAIFGTENSPMAVVIFCLLLSVRFVDFGYCIKDSMINMAIAFLILLVAPVVASQSNPILAILIHFCAFMALLLMTSDRPEMGNGGLCGFAYVFLTGNPVTGEIFWKRAALTLLGYIICGLIFYFKHHTKNADVKFISVVKKFDMSVEKSRWQLRMAIGISLVLALGNFFNIERFMWAGLACGSMLSAYPYTVHIKSRSIYRMIGIVIGSFMFLAIYEITPIEMHSLLGPIGGLCLGFCTDYRFKTAINCLGALMMAAGIYGAKQAVFLRIFDNFLGVIFGLIVIYLYYVVVDKKYLKKSEVN